ncbi:endolysin [Mycobacterium phage Turbido]|uniref:Lysin A n=1 Tax=Mycobacterium phage Turbido TaxID=1071504 RepID=G1JUX7_9CAUD|nr:endolysin [Mycobacterium phage Turbido]AEL17748.1 lysin A [Mycobacterium phage Turbido]
MARRLFRGRRFSENGWPYVDQGSCTWFDVAEGVSMQIQNGPPLAILGAFARDYHAYVEPMFDPDCCCWTQDNSVDTSNHPGGTAFDARWNKHPFQKRGTFTPAQVKVIQELLDFYEGTVFWAGVDWKEGGWGSPIDEMHWQMGYNTYDQKADRPQQWVLDFISRKIRPDGFSTFRRGTTPATPPAAPGEMTVPLTALPNGRWTSPSPAWAHLIMRESSGNPTIIQQIHDVNSGGNEAEGLFQITPRTWLAHNGTQFAPSARFATPQQQAIVAARIFTRNPSGSDWGAGLPGREDPRQLAAGLVPTQTQGEEDFLSALNPDEQRLLFDKTLQVWGALFNQVESKSGYRNPGGTSDPANMWAVKDYVSNIDGFIHEDFVEDQAKKGNLTELARVVRAARGQGANRSPEFIARAQRVIAEIEATNKPLLERYIAAERGGQ